MKVLPLVRLIIYFAAYLETDGYLNNLCSVNLDKWGNIVWLTYSRVHLKTFAKWNLYLILNTIFFIFIYSVQKSKG